MSLEGQQAPEFELDSTSGGTVSLSETLASGPTVVVINRGAWCSFCAEQLSTFSRVAEDLKFNDGVDFLPVVPSDLEDVVEMRDRFDYRFQLAADPDGDVAEQYSGTEQTGHGLTGITGTFRRRHRRHRPLRAGRRRPDGPDLRQLPALLHPRRLRRGVRRAVLTGRRSLLAGRVRRAFRRSISRRRVYERGTDAQR